MLDKINFISNELQQIYVRGIDAVHMANVLNVLQNIAPEAEAFDKWKAEQEAEKGKADNE